MKTYIRQRFAPKGGRLLRGRPLLVQVFERGKHTSDEEPGLLLCKFLVFCEMISQISALH